jgi:hypothetical protein
MHKKEVMYVIAVQVVLKDLKVDTAMNVLKI